MAVSASAVSVIVRNATIEARFPNGMEGFRRSRPNETFCTDGTISRVGFLTETDARTFINYLRAAGLDQTETGAEVALAVQGHGFLYPCDWLQFGLFDGRPCVWLAGTDRGSLFIPKCELDFVPVLMSGEGVCDDYEWVGLKCNGKVEVYRNKTSSELRYVGRPFSPVRKWWQFWKRLTVPLVSAENHDLVNNAACELINPYIGRHYDAVVDRVARRQLQRACEMLSRVLMFNPGNWQARWYRGIAHRCLGELAPAYDDFHRAYDMEKDHPDVGRELVIVCLNLGRGEEAVRVSSQLVQKFPTDPGLLANHALALMIAGRVPEAEAAVKSSLDLAPSDEITKSNAAIIASIRTGRMARPDRWPPR